MKKINIITGVLAILFSALLFSSCEDYDVPLLTDIGADRAFSPVGLTAKVTNQTTVVLSWTANPEADHYIVDFSADDPNFTSIFKTISVTAKELPVSVVLEGLTTYSIRVKAVSAKGVEDSKYSTTTATTLGEELFLPSVDGDIKATSATLRWQAGVAVTNITLTPGNINRVITASEKAAGVATITGLTGDVSYTAKLMNGTKLRGTKSFKTAVDIGDGILIKPTDDLNEKIANAPNGAKLYLEPGDYTVFKGSIVLTKSISIFGLRSYDRPKLHIAFVMGSGVTDVKLQDLDIKGDASPGTNLDLFLIDNAKGSAGNYGDILITGCSIHDFNRLIYGVSANKLNSFKVDNSVFTDFLTSSADFIDFRITHVGNISLTNSTFDNVTVREFIRVDNSATYNNTGLTTTVLVDKCTVYNRNTVAAGRIVYVRFATNKITIQNTLFADNPGIYSNQATTSVPTFVNNNYHNSPGLWTSSGSNKIDTSATLTKENPNFVNGDAGNFTVQNQILKDNKVGDPRWLQ